MKTVRKIKKWLNKLLDSALNLPAGIDSHKWESKIEILGHFQGMN